MSSEPTFDPFAGPAIATTCPTTEAQREIWTGSRFGTDASLAFNEGITLFLEGDFQLKALATALSELVARHEALRSTISADGLTMLVGAAQVPTLKPIDLAELNDAEREKRWWELCRKEVETPFDLEKGPLFRVHVARLSPFEHRVCFTAHHIVCDGFSTGVLVREWAQLYSAQVKKAAASLPAADSFSSFARELTTKKIDTAAHEKFWAEQFKGEIPILQLPYDRPRPIVKTYAALREDVSLPKELVTKLKAAGAKQRASLFNVLLSGFVAMLHRLSSQDDIVVGIPSAGQSAAGLSSLVGHAVNTLPVRARLDPDKPFAALLDTVRKGMLDALEHQEYTFSQLLKVLPLPRDPSRLPLVSVCFNLDKGLSADAMPFEGLKPRLFTNPRRFETFDVFMNAVEIDGRVDLEVQFNTDLFEQRTIKRWLASFQLLLEGVATDVGTEVAKLPVVTEAERKELLAFTQSAADAGKGTCVHELIEATVDRLGSKVAVELGANKLTYQELEATANRVAHKLKALGVGKGDLVGLAIERGPSLVAGLYGILKSGAGYVPLDPGYPAERLSFMVSDAQMPVLLTETKLKDELKLSAKHTLCIDDPALKNESAARPNKGASSAEPESVCYVIYTSGSTGKPKGVLVPHRAVVNLLKSVQREPGMTERDVVLAVTTLSFDIAVSEIILPLTVGATISLASRDVASDGGQLLELLHSCKATFLDATPATWRLLLGAGWQGGEGLTAICTGEALPKDLALELIPKVKTLWNGYGPTETTVWSTFWPVREGFTKVLIGRPVANTGCYVLDAKGQLCPTGVPGELFIGGTGVTLGYLGRPELTKERFVPDPFAGTSHATMYKTGDLVRWLPDGNLECLGRNDTQVKLRGFRIELGEIETALGTHPACRQVAVIVREDKPGDKRLVAYVVFHEGKEASDKELRTHLKLSLPDYMVPQTFARLPKMPLTPSGKIDRRALPKPSSEPQATSDADYVAPRTESEKLLSELWKQALGLPRVSVTDDFFALGGHSLLASQILARLKRDRGVTLSFRKLFEAPTIEKLAPFIDAAGPVAANSAPAGVPKRQGSGNAPASFLQQRLVLLEEMEPSTRLSHNLPAAWRLVGALDVKVLERCIDEVCRRHETLRTTLVNEGGKLTQKVHAESGVRLSHVDLSGLPQAEAEAKLEAEMAKRTTELFEVNQLPLFRLTLFKLNAEEHVLYTVRHNTIWDGWSFDLFLKELSALYPAFVKGEASPLPPLPVTYGDFAAWHNEWLKGPEMEKQIQFWRRQFAELPPPMELPGDRPRPDEMHHKGSNEGIVLPKADHERLLELAKQTGTTLFMVLYAVFDVLLYRFTGDTDLLVGTPVRNRTQPELEDVIGPFINAVALRNKLEPNLTFADFLNRVRDCVLDAFNNQEMPFESLGARPPMVRAFFSLQDSRKRPPGLGEVKVKQVHTLPLAATNDLMLWTMETRDGLLLMLNYSTELFDVETAKVMLGCYRSLLEAVLKDTSQTIAELPLLPAEQLAGVKGFSGKPGEAKTLVSSLPSNGPALESESGSISWAQVHERAKGLSGALVAQRASKGAVVAIGCEGADRLVSTVAALKAGAAVLPIDPSWPTDFIKSQLAAANVAAVVANEELGNELQGVRVISPQASGPAADVALSPDDAALAWLSFDAAGKSALSTVPHRALVASLQGLSQALELKAQARLFCSNALGSEAEALELLLPLVTGAVAVIGAEACARDGELFASELARVKPHVAIASGASWAAAVQAGVSLSGVRVASTSGAVAGITALGVHPVLSRGLVCIATTAADGMLGRPVHGAMAQVRDERGHLLPVGVPGMLWAGPDERSLRPTMQQARWRRDGSLQAWGTSGLAERWGLKFSLALSSKALATHPALTSAAVVAPPHEERLVGFVTVKAGESFTDTELRRHVKGLLPQAMVPQEFHELPQLPKDIAGAIDEAALLAKLKPAVEDVPPRTPNEQLLADLWRSALNLPRVSIRDNFFNLGGHSLLAFRVLADVEKQTGKKVHPRLMLLSTLEQVAARIDQA